MKLKYEVFMGFINHWGELTDITRIAAFCSRERAEEYIDFCDSSPEDMVKYVIHERK